MSTSIFKKPEAVVSLKKKKTNKYSPFFDSAQGNVYLMEAAAIDIGATIATTVIATVVGEIVITAWPY